MTDPFGPQPAKQFLGTFTDVLGRSLRENGITDAVLASTLARALVAGLEESGYEIVLVRTGGAFRLPS